ncbi:MAG: lipopolysaccharide transport periplasmic protein LptA [Chromatiales bacterium]|nr:lipopolysaccharide transport periplasmic protein LptA [Chromatiales bacterium]
MSISSRIAFSSAPKFAGGFCPEFAIALFLGAALCLPALATAAEGGPPPAGSAATRAIPQLAPADPTLPIDLDAAFSELDRRNNRLIFRQLNIRQGALAIKADEATADPADFENSLWVFTGNVSIVNGGTRASCDRAELTFRDNRLRKAVLTGKPARFSQAGAGGNPDTEGRGELLEYNLDAATIEMSRDAFLSDGKSEISGSRIAYDLRREVVTAGGADGGQVRMRITPQQKPAPPAGPTEPAP